MFQTKLRELREAAGYTSQQAFADAFGVAQSTVGGWEAGKREPNYDTTIRLARFFGVTIDTLLLDEPIPPSFVQPKISPAISAEALKGGKSFERLFSLYQALDDRDQGELIGYAKGLLTQEKYKRKARSEEQAG